MQKINSLRLLEQPNFLAWVYPSYLPVPQDVINKTYDDFVRNGLPRIFYLTKAVVDQVDEVMHPRTEEQPDGSFNDELFNSDVGTVINAPFEKVMIEAAEPLVRIGTDCGVYQHLISYEEGWAKGISTTLHQDVLGICVFEVAPGEYKCLAIVHASLGNPELRKYFDQHSYNTQLFIDDERLMAVMVLHEDGPEPDPSATEPQFFGATAQNCRIFAKALFDQMKTKYAVGEERMNERIRIGSGKKRELHKIKDLIHVVLKKEKKTYLANTSRKIDWTHRWEVMGHWRKVETIGKDRQGKYGIKGFTWVSAHVKGPDEMMLVPKIRVVKE